MIAYFSCRCGRNKLLIQQLSSQGYEIRITNLNPEWRKQARQYKEKMPFKVDNGVVTRL